MQHANMALAQPPVHQELLVPLTPPSRVLSLHHPELAHADLEHLFSHYKGFRWIWRNMDMFPLIEFGTGPQAVSALQDAVSIHCLKISFAGQNSVNEIEAQWRNHIHSEMELTIAITLKLSLHSGFDEYECYLRNTRRDWLKWENDIMKDLFRLIQDMRTRQQPIVERAAIDFLMNPQPHVALSGWNFYHSLLGCVDLPRFVDVPYARDYFGHCKSLLGL